MHGPSGRAQSWSVFDRRQPTPTPIASSPAPFSYPVEGPSRSSSVAYSSPQSGPRFKTVIHPEQYDERELRQKLLQSRARLQTSFDAIAEKYGSVPPEEDDEIDLFTGNVTKNRGHLLELEPRLFAEGSDYQDEAVEDDQDGIRLDQLRLHSEPVRGPDQIEFPEDEDELGDWGDKSGLDAQFPATEIEQEWTAEDLVDLEEFMRAEALRRARCGEEELEYERFQGASSSPLRNLSQLVLETSPEVEEVEVMDEPELYENSRVHSQRRVTLFNYQLLPQKAHQAISQA
ncbi:hypothetical protein CC85DRAFT_298656 [Cutaneotrichosporon oleaginosum]|uniref:Uncharacterized protein n=1 Tax=Cutaneotrichosporon oleaginosum TaxID=879819 RepID=A0A0J0XZK4_9TREE|nr:uncharacterized protein CC85DRAFT_298656 [Cutaneotrichosporon oleaginosum]KLT46462.1 hypothetical protein CC85DRAFT_298656 [Cutaneotrichosporon oleaginosum]